MSARGTLREGEKRRVASGEVSSSFTKLFGLLVTRHVGHLFHSVSFRRSVTKSKNALSAKLNQTIPTQIPRIAVTMGDPAGIGPELCLRLLAHAETIGIATPIVFGDAGVLRHVAEKLALPF